MCKDVSEAHSPTVRRCSTLKQRPLLCRTSRFVDRFYHGYVLMSLGYRHESYFINEDRQAWRGTEWGKRTQRERVAEQPWVSDSGLTTFVCEKRTPDVTQKMSIPVS